MVMIIPRRSDLLRLTESAQLAEGRGVLGIYGQAPYQAPADEGGSPGNQVFDGQQTEGAPSRVQRTRTRDSTSEFAEQVDADRTRLIDQLQERPAVGGVGVNVMLEK
jgi:hypothetical protein